MDLTYWTSIAVGIGIFAAPVLITGAYFRRQKLQKVHPIREKCLRPSGESTRKEMDRIWDKITDTMLIMIPSVFLVLFAGQGLLTIGNTYLRDLLLLLIFPFSAVCQSYAGVKLFRLSWRYRCYKLGFAGERFVGQILTDELMPEGCRVFHDLQFDGFNIDHVIVSSCAVFAVETKTWRKPVERHSGKVMHQIEYNGSSLLLPNGMGGMGALAQAQRNATFLANWLTKQVGDKVDVVPMLALPGWFVKTTGRGAVKVINPKLVRTQVFRPDSLPMEASLFRRIVNQLSQASQMELE